MYLLINNFITNLARMISALDSTSNIFPRMNWRFQEFPNEGTHTVRFMTVLFEVTVKLYDILRSSRTQRSNDINIITSEPPSRK